MNSDRKSWHPWVFLTPAMLLLSAILIIPIGYSLYLSFFDADGASWFSGTSPFVGLTNYIELMSDQSFGHSVFLLLVYIVATTTIELALALALALYLDQVVEVPSTVKTLIILPMFVLPVVSGLTFRYLFDPEGGVLGTLFYWFGLEAPDMLGDPILAFIVVILQDVWRMGPFLFVIIYAGLKSMPRDPIEAIQVDGGNFWQTSRYVILPALKGTLVVAVLLKVIESLKAFTEIYVMTGGGPGESTTILSMFIIKQMTDFAQYGYGTAASTILLVVGIGVTLLLGYVQRRHQQGVAH